MNRISIEAQVLSYQYRLRTESPSQTYIVHAIFWASLIGVAALFASAQSNADATEEDKRTAEEVRRLNIEEVQAFLHKDAKSVSEFVIG